MRVDGSTQEIPVGSLLITQEGEVAAVEVSLFLKAVPRTQLYCPQVSSESQTCSNTVRWTQSWFKTETYPYIDNIIITLGENVEPLEIEQAAMRSKLIEQIVVIGQVLEPKNLISG